LVDMATRDRRWAQGNLQHLGFVGARGLDWVSRAHIVAGIMGYLSPALWFGMIVVSIAIAYQVRPELPTAFTEYFEPKKLPNPFEQTIDPRSLNLFALTALVVLSPKWLALTLWACGRLPGWSRDIRFLCGLAVETCCSIFTAPILMVNQTAAVVFTLLGQDAGWRAQVRDRDSTDFDELLRRFSPHMALAMSLIAICLAVNAEMIAWAAPVLASLLFAAPISWLLAQKIGLGTWLWAWTSTPEEVQRPDIVTTADATAEHKEVETGGILGVAEAAIALLPNEEAVIAALNLPGFKDDRRPA
jgi:membrane glycosyltransferase